MRRITWLCLTLLLPAATVAQTARSPKPALTVGRIDSVWSPTLNEERKLLVYTPPSYDSSRYLPQRYPVLYLLDGEAHFASVSGLMQILSTGINGSYVIPPMIVVAIPNTDRTRDLTPTHSDLGVDGKTVTPAFKTSGGGANFLHFVQSELIPHIDSMFRTTDYRIFVGHSFGGITVIDALYTMPETFNAYVAIDPSLWWDREVLLKQARGFFSRPALADRTLFVAQANTISPNDTTLNLHYNSILEFNAILDSYNRSRIRYAYRYFPDDDHGSVPLIAEYTALRYVFDGYHVDLAMALDDPSYLTRHFAEMSARLGAKFQPPEAMVDQFAAFEMTQDTTKAIALLQLNADLYPDSPNAFNELGDAWKAKGDRTRALADYQHVLGIDRANKHATDAVRQLRAGSGTRNP